ncbi:hypothetical protein KCP76_04510 [Salmonella enterica subsp. enterica serovar Weltevreden]|nr:hypothetical protein KCP76_04510 [Salmonella enterica subsp. enterica serovar Weltevreden]
MVSVYPRWRGEHTSVIAAAFYILVYSLARGTPDIEIPELNITSVLSRWRGEHNQLPAIAVPAFVILAGAGTRHKAAQPQGKRFFFRFILAGAGNTSRS